ncbi:hypothetical protein EPK99_06600 [Neorhizobium lilium]|uniref:Uncharacterized protein n=1 Tax=Neorhizobium lilium TaxID=2503024 RepID=A0A444LH98_9HYPH|nr:hypothetical protein [Neorhizobium lilium]RWX78294.1 hypothetical protein EPK99_06600 [Neorhizobium lilium]
MADKFKIMEMKREGDQWAVKVAVPTNMLGFSSFSVKVEAEMNPPGGGVVDRDIADVLKTVGKRTAYAFQVLANVAFEALDEESVKSVKGAILHDATHSPDRT